MAHKIGKASFGWSLSLEAQVSDVPDLPVRHTSKIMAPSLITVVYKLHPGERGERGEFHRYNIYVRGHRRLKSGDLGAQEDFTMWSADRPAWMEPILDALHVEALCVLGAKLKGEVHG